MYSDLSEVLPQDLFEELKAQDLYLKQPMFPQKMKLPKGLRRKPYCGIRLDGLDYFKDRGILLDDMAPCGIRYFRKAPGSRPAPFY